MTSTDAKERAVTNPPTDENVPTESRGPRTDTADPGRGNSAPPAPSRRRFHAAALLLAGGGVAACASPPGMPTRRERAAARSDTADWLDQVRIEHRAVDAAFERLLATADAGERAKLRDALADALVLHSVQEETVLYPVMALSGNAPTAQQLYADHAQVNVLLAELEMMPRDHPTWPSRVQNLRTLIARHVQEEETQLYPQLRAKLAPEDNRVLTVRYRNERRRFDPT